MTSLEEHLASVLAVYPNADPDYVHYCLQQHPYSEKAAEHVVNKMTHLNHGHFPTVQRGVAPNSTRAKNAIMRRIVKLIPEVDLNWLRHQIHLHGHSHFYKVIDTMFTTVYPQRLVPDARQSRQQRLHASATQHSPKSQKATQDRLDSSLVGDPDDGLDIEPLIEPWEYIRSTEYIKSVRRQLYNEFPKVWKSTIKAVMAENNFDYMRTYDRLVQLETENSWARWFSDVLCFIQRAKISKSGEDPPEFLEDLAAFQRRAQDRQSVRDEAMAREVNAEEYRTHGQTIDCGCCFSDYCFEEMASCQDGHLFCKDCIQRYVQEGLFGQGDLRGRRGGRGGVVRCMESSDCQALFSDAMLEWALTPELYEQYTRLAFQADIDCSGLEMVRCSFCDYAEAQVPLRVVWLPWQRQRGCFTTDNGIGVTTLRLLTHLLLPLVPLAPFLVGIFVYVVMFLLLLLPFLLTLVPLTVVQEKLQGVVDGMVRNIQVRRRGQAFHCPGCGRTSCLNCSQERRPLHKCHENLAEGLRLQVEKAMTEAVKRTCPKCNLSFVKESGCNKMRCSCGYIMCFRCRKDIREEGYKHFCNHFRAIAGPCTQCNKCDLYMVEKDEEAAKKAAAIARAEYLRMNPKAREHLQGDQTLIGPAPDTDGSLEGPSTQFMKVAESVFELLFVEEVVP